VIQELQVATVAQRSGDRAGQRVAGKDQPAQGDSVVVRLNASGTVLVRPL
jgi:hypothetical protein